VKKASSVWMDNTKHTSVRNWWKQLENQEFYSFSP